MRARGPGRRSHGWTRGQPRRRAMGPAVLATAGLAAAALVLAAGCSAKGRAAAASSPSPNGAASPTATSSLPNAVAHGTRCGTTKTAVNVPIQVYLAHSTLSCTAALAVEEDYAKAIKDGSAPGNGGGGPVTIDGWTCRGFATPVVLQTGQASKCQRGPAVILAMLPPPTASATP